MSHPHIIKRKGRKEPYDNHKVYASCYAACLNTHMPKEEAEGISRDVMKEIDQWIDEKKDVSSQDIFQEVTKTLGKYNKEAAFMYETHRDVS